MRRQEKIGYIFILVCITFMSEIQATELNIPDTGKRQTMMKEIERLKSSDPQERISAIRNLKEMKTLEAVTVLINMLDDTRTVTTSFSSPGGGLSQSFRSPSQEAMEALAELGQPVYFTDSIMGDDATYGSRVVIEPLIQLLNNPQKNIDIKEKAAWILHYITENDFGTNVARWQEWWEHDPFARRRPSNLSESQPSDSELTSSEGEIRTFEPDEIAVNVVLDSLPEELYSKFETQLIINLDLTSTWDVEERFIRREIIALEQLPENEKKEVLVEDWGASPEEAEYFVALTHSFEIAPAYPQFL